MKFKKDFSKVRGPGARTLGPDDIGTNESGWAITGEIHEDYYYWVNDFEAKKGKWWVKGNFEGIVEASSEKAYEDFIKNHPYNEWDYGDI
jgi:hypothetical protein